MPTWILIFALSMRFIKFLLTTFCVLVLAQMASAQRRDPVRRYNDSVAAARRAETAAYMKRLDSLATTTARQSYMPLFTINSGTVAGNEWFITKPVQVKATGKEPLFYLLALLLLVLGLVRVSFPKYFSDLFGIFFRVTFRQQSIREQLLQNALPSLLLNVIFFFSGGLFLTLLSQYYGWVLPQGFWYNFLFWSVLLVVVYAFKLLVMKSLSWLFHLREAGKTYSFIVFLINKVIGVLLLPFIVFMALGPVEWRPVIVTLSITMLAGLFIYRYLISYPSVKNTVRVNRFHFIIYLWALEIVPLLLIYKGLALQLSKN
jgi:hypothetical protein